MIKKESLLIALGIGFIVFILNWDEKPDLHSNNQIKLAAIGLGFYFLLKRHFKADKQNKENKITFIEVFKVGAFLCLLASLLAGLLYLAIPDQYESLAYHTSKIIRSLDVLISVVFIGLISSAISSGIIIKQS